MSIDIDEPKKDIDLRRIAFDCDDVLVDYVGGLIEYTWEQFGVKKTRSDMASYLFEEFWGCSKDDAVVRADRFHRTERFRNLSPIEGAKEGIKALKLKMYDLAVITSRVAYTMSDTDCLLNRHFEGKFSGVYYSKNRYTGWGEKEKPDICREIGVGAIVEDNLDNAKECAWVCRVILLDAPWNQVKPGEKLPDKITRVKSWTEIVDEIGKMAA